MGATTVTVRTLGAGLVTLAEPAWCLGHHPEGGHRVDIAHQGPETAIGFHGFGILAASLVAYPFAETRDPAPAVAVDMGGDWLTLDAEGLDALAVALVDHAAKLRSLARQLSALLAAGEVPG
ncbi:DUF6907 domain-containing protein [Streptomyces albireticuli]|uniref:Uncharacterized protein n=1 Tax=Streptomyces albireticuli TaxID=1940 RepID=A0A2A2CWF7_9ACTN|nr:hypothetical protein [Streptomyces albireticuli]MCD9145799.1 hypothetical protein [Streptomyces albireticuli]MCD9165876.1 hypothetical protein [Streptomyces albireticuli]MCD9194445.1 hypothetical protein [Streptomyces albireticuli]PAU44548.1 hypothetical protein CK936_34250 [Streptomyces albireticuli]